MAGRCSGKRVFIATAEPFDDEIRDRIEKHREERGKAFQTVEEPLDLAGALRALSDDVEIAVVDCLTLWLGNLMHYRGEQTEVYPEVSELIQILDAPPCDLIFVTNEVGMGVIPENAMARRFRDAAAGSIRKWRAGPGKWC